MKKLQTILVLTGLLMVNSIVAQNLVERDGVYFNEFGQPFSGHYSVIDDNGQLAAAYYFEKGKLNDSYTLYHANGNLKESGHYADNKRVGRWQSWDKKRHEASRSALLS